MIISIRLHKTKIKINSVGLIGQQNLKIFSNWTHQKKKTHTNSFSYISKIQQENNMKKMSCIKKNLEINTKII